METERPLREIIVVVVVVVAAAAAAAAAVVVVTRHRNGLSLRETIIVRVGKSQTAFEEGN